MTDREMQSVASTSNNDPSISVDDVAESQKATTAVLNSTITSH